MPQAIDEQAGHDNGADPVGANPPQDPATATSARGKTKYNVCLRPESLEAIHDWLLSEGREITDPEPPADSLPASGGAIHDLTWLGTYSAANKDAAVDMMLADKRPTDRVRLVQLAHEAHLDLYFPTPPVSSLTAVPKEWQQEWTLKPAGRS